MSTYGGYEDAAFVAELYEVFPPYVNRRDVGFYVDLCREAGGPVLELGCGTGRVLAPIAETGVDVVGLDLSPYMLAKCRDRLAAQPRAVRDRVQLVEGNMIDFDLGRKFAAVIIPFRPLQHLVSVSDQLACLRCARRHLRDGGLLAFDLFQVNFDVIANPKFFEETEDFSEIALEDGRTLRRCRRFAATHRAEQYNDVELIYYVTDVNGETERYVQPFPFRYFFRYEVEHLLARAGFDVAALYGDFGRSPLGDESSEMIFVTRPRRETAA